MGSILEHHGRSLKNLWLVQSLGQGESPSSWKDRYMNTTAVLSQLLKHCSNLEELVLPIRRSKGDKAEVEIYKMLGSLRKLRTLQLTLDCSDYSVLWAFEDPEDDGEGEWPEPPGKAHFDNFDRKLYPQKYRGQLHIRNGYIRDTFINCAVDEALAREIFRCVSSGKAVSDSLLERLVVKVRGGAVFRAGDGPLASVRHIVREISRDWELERCVRDDRRDEVLARDVTVVRFEAPLGPPDEHYESIKAGEDILRTVWPEVSRESGSWKTQWKSFPLEMDI
jgi:hypothetical protein